MSERRGPVPPPVRSVADTERLVHELEVHQVELAQQNEELQATRDALATSLRRYVELYDFSPVALVTLDRALNVREINRRGCELLGLTRHGALGHGLVGMLAPGAQRRLHALLADPREAVGTVFDLTLSARRGERVLRAEARPDPRDPAQLLLALIDVTEARAHVGVVERLALHDALTGLANRAQALDRLDAELRQAQGDGGALALMFVDLDHFKTVNDTLGHQAGDELLRQASTRLRSTLRTRDLLARLGGDEFLVLVPHPAGTRDAEHLAERLLAAMAEPFAIAGRDVYLTASVGVSRFPRDAAEATALLRFADIALYRAKDDGRNNVKFFEATMDEDASRTMRLRGDLHHALERDELRLHYQPQVDVESGHVVGHEALLRWQHPADGLLAPDRFVPIAEECGLIVPIGDWVLDQAARQHQAWVAGGAGDGLQRVAANVSARQLQRPGLVESVQRTLQRSGLAPERLELEITESAVMHDPVHALEVLHALARLGVRLAIDDFGVGQSGLGLLKRMPVQRLKIDRSFVAGLPADEGDAAIVRAIIAMSSQLGLDVVAEGVETVAQRDFLRAAGVRVMQGWLLGRPAAAGD